MNGFDNDAFDPAVLERARQKVKLPGMFLIVTGVLGLFLAALYLYPLTNVAAYFKQQRDIINQNPGLNAAQKQQMIDVFDQMEPMAVPYFAGLSAVTALTALIVIVGGVKLKNLSGRGWAMFGSIVAMVPCCVSYCCVLGMPVGIWAFVAMSNPDVKAAFARNRKPTSGNDFDSYPSPV